MKKTKLGPLQLWRDVSRYGDRWLFVLVVAKWTKVITVRRLWFLRLQDHWRYRWRWSPFPIYWERYSRDCDHCSREWYERHPNGWTAYRAYCDAMDYAEGPERFCRVSRQEYERYKHESSFRDHILEAHENGHPFRVAE